MQHRLCSSSTKVKLKGNQHHGYHLVMGIVTTDREFEFYEFFSFLKFNEFYEFFLVEKKIPKKFVILQIIDV